MTRWMRTRTRAQLVALVLFGALLPRVAVNAASCLPLSPVRSWVWVEMPFDLVRPVQSFWFEVVLILAAMIAFAWASRDWRVRPVLSLAVSLVVLDLLASIGSYVALILGTGAVQTAEHLPISPPSWDLLAVDAPSFLFWSAGTTSVALLAFSIVGRVIGRRGEQALQPDAPEVGATRR